jgi:hypothetical protein
MRWMLGDCSTEKAYKLIRSGAVKYLDGGARMVLVSSIHNYVARRLGAATPVNGERTRNVVAKSVEARRAKRVMVADQAEQPSASLATWRSQPVAKQEEGKK